MANQVVPARLSPKARDEATIVTIDWEVEIGEAGIITVEYQSKPVGLTFTDPTIDKQKTRVVVGSGVPGYEYRILCKITAIGFPDMSFHIRSGDMLGVPIYILPEDISHVPLGDYAYGVT